MVGYRKPVDIDVHIVDKPGNTPPYDYYMKSSNHKVDGPKRDTLTFNNDGKWDGFLIRFHVKDDTSPRQNFLFMDVGKLANGEPDPDLAPMWVKPVEDFEDTCPHREFWPVFNTFDVQSNNKKLVVINKNPENHPQKFKFAFLFSREPNKAGHQIMYDPNGDNTNGPKPLFSRSLLLPAAIGGAIVGCLLTLGAQALMAT